jgi:hypothetical protein
MNINRLIFTFVTIVLIIPFCYSTPNMNGGSGCGGSGCHTFQTGIVSVTLLSNLQVRITVAGTSSKVAGELVNSSGSVVAVINSTSTNPFILTAPSAGIYKVNAGYKSPSRRWDSTTVDVSLPVELISFNASANGSAVSLSWATATELNNNGFEIERKFGSGNWEPIGFVKGAGTTTSTTNYTFSDRNISSKTTYSYRLKQLDFDGTLSYSKVVQVSTNLISTFELCQNYPNPFNPNSMINFSIPSSGLVTLKVYDLIGKEVAVLLNEVKEPGTYNVNFNAENLSSGIYLYKLQTGIYAATRKMILLK